MAGFIGIASCLLIDFNALIALLPVGTEVLHITPALKLLSLLQPSIFLTLAVFAGAAFARKVGLSAPAFEAWAMREPIMQNLRPQWLPGLLGGLGGGTAILLIAAIATPGLPPGAAAKISAFAHLMPFATRLLYGGITEEVLLRWGLMSLLVWAAWRLFQKHRERPTSACFHAAIVVSALIFGAGHLPVAFFVVPQPNVTLVAFVIFANAAFGVVAGYLFWKRGLESAIVAHIVTHGVLLVASRMGAYF